MKSTPRERQTTREITGFILGVVGFMLAGLVAIYLGLLIFAPRDANAPDTQDLQAKLEIASPTQTAITAKFATLKKFRLDPNQFFQIRGWSNSEANRLLDEYKPDLANFEAFSKLPAVVSQSRNPTIKTFTEFTQATNFNLLNVAKLGDLMLIRAELKGRSNDPRGFLDDLLIVARVAKLERNSAGTLLEYLVGSKMLRSVLERFRAGILSLDMKPNEWKSRLDALANLEPNPLELQNTIKTEFRMQQLGISETSSNPSSMLKNLQIQSPDEQNSDLLSQITSILPANYVFQKNTTLTWFSNYAKAVIQASNNCPPNQKESLTILDNFQKQFTNPLSANGTGRSLFAYLLPNYNSILDARCKLATDFAATITVGALRGYQLERKDLPKTLSSLVPDYLSKILPDPFSSNPLELDFQRRVLQSKSGAVFKLGF